MIVASDFNQAHNRDAGSFRQPTPGENHPPQIGVIQCRFEPLKAP